jgi:hypothetical protein
MADTPRGRPPLKLFSVHSSDVGKAVMALHAESAVKKAFRSPAGSHWAPCTPKQCDARVLELFHGPWSYFRLEDNG